MAMRNAGTGRALNYIVQKRGYLFLLCVFLAFMQAGFYAGRSDLDSYLDPEDKKWLAQSPNILPHADARPKNGVREHPIPKLMADAEDNFRKKVSRQSQTLKAAVKEYRKRYHRDPPKGFDEWWQFTRDYNVKMVDEYDGLVEDLAPFWEISGAELRRRAVQVSRNVFLVFELLLRPHKVAQLPSIDLVRVRDGNASAVNINGFENLAVSARATGFHQMLEKFEHRVYNISFCCCFLD